MALRSILEALPAAVLHTDEHNQILACNQAACSWFGCSNDEMVGRNLSTLLLAPEPDSDKAEALWLRRGSDGGAVYVRRRDVANEGGVLWVFDDGSEERAGRLETSRRLIESREEERLRLARDLHDGAIQELIGINFGLAELRRKWAGTLADAELEKIRVQQGNVQGVVRLLRALMSELRPAGLEEFGLAAAIEGLAAKMARGWAGRTRLRLDLKEVPKLTMPRQLCLFRGAQEALNNCLRHAQATEVLVRLRLVGPFVELSVEDDGVGFLVPPRLAELTRGQHYGLAGMAERAELVTGALAVLSSPGGGTKVRLSVQGYQQEAS